MPWEGGKMKVCIRRNVSRCPNGWASDARHTYISISLANTDPHTAQSAAAPWYLVESDTNAGFDPKSEDPPPKTTVFHRFGCHSPQLLGTVVASVNATGPRSVYVSSATLACGTLCISITFSIQRTMGQDSFFHMSFFKRHHDM